MTCGKTPPNASLLRIPSNGIDAFDQSNTVMVVAPDSHRIPSLVPGIALEPYFRYHSFAL